jgi:hypothetical protein
MLNFKAPAPPDTKLPGKSNVRPLSGAMAGEESNAYRRVIARLNPQWRIIACRHSIQWVLQRRKGKAWRSRCFCRTREGLLLCAREYAAPIGGEALAILLRLPERFPEAAP